MTIIFKLKKLLFLLLFIVVLFRAIPVSADQQIQPTKDTYELTEDFAATGQEFLAWLTSHANTGGRLSLTSDITIEDNFDLGFLSDCYVDCGPYTITVMGQLFWFGYLNISGDGSPQGMIRIKPHGGLFLVNGATVSAGSGISIWQEEHSVFGSDQTQENVHYAESPVITNYDKFGSEYVIVPKDVEYNDFLPNALTPTIFADVNFKGKSEIKELPVNWEIDKVASQLDEKKRTIVYGNFGDYELIQPITTPKCTVIFHNRDVVFENVNSRDFSDISLLFLDYLLPSRPLELTFNYSFDEENWSPLFQITQDGTQVKDSLNITLCRNQEDVDPLTETDLWWPNEFSTISFHLSWQENGETMASDVLRFENGTFTSGIDVGGNRGGGGDISSKPLPPEIGDKPPESSEVPPESSEVPPESSEIPPGSSEAPPESSEAPPESSEIPPESSEIPPESSKTEPPASSGALSESEKENSNSSNNSNKQKSNQSKNDSDSSIDSDESHQADNASKPSSLSDESHRKKNPGSVNKDNSNKAFFAAIPVTGELTPTTEGNELFPKAIQIILGVALTAGILGAFIYHGKKR